MVFSVCDIQSLVIYGTGTEEGAKNGFNIEDGKLFSLRSEIDVVMRIR